ncbi:MAG: DUF4070 domain-containing protein, partial [Polyangiaceae bacterium]
AGKKQNKPHQYGEVVRCLSDHGIGVWGSFIFGLDDDSPDAFERTVDFCIEAKVTMAVFALLTPYPGTALYKRLKVEGRITKDGWWLSSDHDTDAPFYRPATMSREVLRAGWVRAWQSMYSMSSIRRRYDFGMSHSWIQNVAYWPLNLLMHELAEKKIAGGDRAWRKHRTLDIPLGL